MLEISDDTHAETFSERRELAASEAGRKALLMDFIAILHAKVMEGDLSDSNLLRAIQTAEKLHRTLTDPAIAPKPQTETDTPPEDDPYAYDHTNMHKEIAEMSDDDLLSEMDRLVGSVERKSAFARNPRSSRSELMETSAFSSLGEAVSTPTKAQPKRRE